MCCAPNYAEHLCIQRPNTSQQRLKHDESIPSSLARSTIWNARGRKRKRGSDLGKHRIWSQNLNFETHPHLGYFFTDSNMSQIALQLKETLRYCLATAELIMAFIILVFSERFRVYQTMHEYAITKREYLRTHRNHPKSCEQVKEACAAFGVYRFRRATLASNRLVSILNIYLRTDCRRRPRRRSTETETRQNIS